MPKGIPGSSGGDQDARETDQNRSQHRQKHHLELSKIIFTVYAPFNGAFLLSRKKLFRLKK
jgi:hypothetical protein